MPIIILPLFPILLPIYYHHHYPYSLLYTPAIMLIICFLAGIKKGQEKHRGSHIYKQMIIENGNKMDERGEWDKKYTHFVVVGLDVGYK